MKAKFIVSVLVSLVIAVVMGSGIAYAVAVPQLALPASGCLFALSFVQLPQIGGVAMATVYREVWEKEVTKSVDASLKDTFLDGIPDKSQYVTGDGEVYSINSVYWDVEPDVLINNTTYPIEIQTLDGTPYAITLDKFQTKATPITDDELFALSYDKMGNVKKSHGSALVKNMLKKGIHALAPASNTANTPVLITTGAATPDGTRLRLKWDDIVALREAWTKAGFAIEDLRLVLCQDHVNDLLLADQAFQRSYANFQNGIITNQLGLEIREYAANPYYTVATKAKLSFGGVVTNAHRQASVVFSKMLARKAQVPAKMYFSEAKTDPLNQRNLINFRNYNIVMPSQAREIGAIVSGIPG